MRRILVVFILVFAFEGLLAAESDKLDKALQKQIKKSQTNGNSGQGSPNSGPGNGTANGKVRVIIQTDGDPDSSGVTEFVNKQGKVLYKFRVLSGIAAELPLPAVVHAAAHSRVRRVSLDTSVSGSLLPNDVSVVDVN